MTDKTDKIHWTDRHITPGYFAWDETGAYPIGFYSTKKDAKQALIEYAKTLDERNNQNGSDPSTR